MSLFRRTPHVPVETERRSYERALNAFDLAVSDLERRIRDRQAQMESLEQEGTEDDPAR